MKKHHTQVEHRHCYLKTVLDQNERMIMMVVVEEVEVEEDIWELKKMMIVWKRRY